MTIIYKRGITLIGITITIIVVLILTTTITISAASSINNAKKLTFALELLEIQEAVNDYRNSSEDGTYPINSDMVLNTSTLGENVSQFGETIVSNEISLYGVDLQLIGIEDNKYGNNDTNLGGELDVYAVSKDTGTVYYLNGLAVGSKKYYTLTDELIKIINKENKKNTETPTGTVDNTSPSITTSGFTVNISNNGTSDIYLNNILATDAGTGVKTVKYETERIAADTAQAYFKNNGRILKDVSIKIKNGQFITLYAEDHAGNYVVKYEGIPIIPDGFYYVGGTVPTGVVISDSASDANKGTSTTGDVISTGLIGNQFVWIPVDFELTGTPDTNNLYPGFKSVFARTTTYNGTITPPANNYIEPLTSSGYAGEWEDYNNMMRSVQANKGFYIGRYEAGKEESDKLVVKKGANAWNRIAWGESMSNIGTTGAVYRSQQMYVGSQSVESTLCYGVQWDTALKFISSDKDVLNSTTWGNYSNNIERASITPNNPAKTGACENWKSKNIYDMAGNIEEWTMEAHSTSLRVVRGGYHENNGTSNPVTYRNDGFPDRMSISFGFRVALYIK